MKCDTSNIMKNQKLYCLRKVNNRLSNGINGHTTYYCLINKIYIVSNNNISGDKWHIDNGGEFCDTKWSPTPTDAIISFITPKK